MSLYRVVLVGLAAVFTVGMTSLASAGGWGWGAGWGSGWGSGFGCGSCAAPSAAVIYAQPVAPPPLVVGGGCGCGCGCGHQSLVYAAPPIEPTPIAPAPIYVVNQGPAYEGPGITVPYHTWSPVSAYGPATAYGDDEGYGYGAGYGLGYGAGYGLGYGYRHHFGYGHRYGLGYRRGLGFRYGFGPRPWRFGAHLAFHRPFAGYPGRHWPTPMLRHRWYR